MTTKKIVVDADATEDIEIKPESRIAKLKRIAANPTIVTAAIGATAFVIVCAYVARHPDDINVEVIEITDEN